MRQAGLFRATPGMREDFAVGHAMARDGSLTRAARTAVRGDLPAELIRVRREKLDAGRRTRALRAGRRTDTRVRSAGFPDVATALHALYVERELSIEEVARHLAVGRGRVPALLAQQGIPVRATGVNSGAGKRARVGLNDARAAERVGAEDIVLWLREGQAAGATLRGLAAAVGRSVPWVVARLRR